MEAKHVLEEVCGYQDLSRGIYLWYLIDKHKLKTALEIGTASSFSTAWMVKAGATVTTIDIIDKSDESPDFLPEYDKSRVKRIIGDSTKVLPKLKQKFDIIFIDGNHDYEFVKQDIINSLKMEPKFIVMHDYNIEAGVTQAIDEVLGKPSKVIIDDFNKKDAGIVVWRKNEEV